MEQHEELVEVVDDDDHVVGVVPRSVVRARNLRHRSVGIAVRSADGRLLVHRRAEHKDVWPGMWDLCVGGVVAAGESYDDAARRELAEEVGITSPAPRWIAHGTYEDADVRAVVHLYSVVHDGPYRFDDGEVVEARLVGPHELAELAATQRFVPDSWALALPLLDDFAGVQPPDAG